MAGTKDSVSLATPGLASTATLICPDAHGPTAAILTGRVLPSHDPDQAPSAEICARWAEEGRRWSAP
jgi:hypothetical protein